VQQDSTLSDHWHHIAVVMMAIFLLALTLSYFLVGVGYDYIGGQSGSYETDLILANNVVLRSDVKVHLTNLYMEDSNETIICLLGDYYDDLYVIDDYYTPEIIDRSFTHVRSVPCDSETLISLHTHPLNRCIFSQADLDSHRNLKRNNPDILLGMMCSPTRFTFYR